MNSHKESVRKAVRRQRKQLEKENKRQMDEKILEKLLALPEINQAELVYAYASIDGEVDTYELIRRLWIKQIRVALPKVEGKEVFFYIVDNFEELISGSYGILEPGEGCSPALGISGPVITPGLAFSREGVRVGYGGGYYDRFFCREPGHVRIGVAYPFQIRKLDCAEWHDWKVDGIVTPTEVIWSEPSDRTSSHKIRHGQRAGIY